MTEDIVIPMLIFALPILAIVGGITAGIVRAIGQQRLIELAQRERIAAIERGIDPEKLAPITSMAGAAGMGLWTPHDLSVRRSQSLMIGGLICVAAGLALGVFLRMMEIEENVWAIGLMPLFVGIALLISARLVQPKN